MFTKNGHDIVKLSSEFSNWVCDTSKTCITKQIYRKYEAEFCPYAPPVGRGEHWPNAHTAQVRQHDCSLPDCLPAAGAPASCRCLFTNETPHGRRNVVVVKTLIVVHTWAVYFWFGCFQHVRYYTIIYHTLYADVEKWSKRSKDNNCRCSARLLDNSRIRQLRVLPNRELVNPRTGQVAYWTARELVKSQPRIYRRQ